MKTVFILLLLLTTSMIAFAKPNFLGGILTVGYIKKNLSDYTIKRGDYDKDNNDSPFADGDIIFTSGRTIYEIETDSRGVVTSERQSMEPNSYNEMISLINYYKSEGRVTKDETSGSYRTIGLYLSYRNNLVISSDITARWEQNSLGRQWDFKLNVQYIQTSR